MSSLLILLFLKLLSSKGECQHEEDDGLALVEGDITTGLDSRINNTWMMSEDKIWPAGSAVDIDSKVSLGQGTSNTSLSTFVSHNCSQYDINNLPHPRFILLGPTGVGKSSLANQLLGLNPRNASEAVFSVGHSVDSHTLNITWVVGNWLGDGPCFTIIDTPGSSDSEGRDYEQALTMANIMKNQIKSVDIFLLCFNGEKPRFDQSIIDQLKLYESIFSKEIWKHVVTEVTFWSHDRRSVRKRKRNMGMDELKRHKEWNSQYKNELNVATEIPSVYIDPVLPIFDAEEKDDIEEREILAFKKYTDELFDYGKNITPFRCHGNCKAPNGYFLGDPWIKTNNIVERQGERTLITCQIWNGIQGKAAHNVTWTHNGEIIYMKTKNTYESESLINITDVWGSKVKFFESISPGRGHYTEFTIQFESLEESMEGTYTCENGRIANDNYVEVLIKVDGTWGQWGSWGKCSKSCLGEDNQMGSKRRIRKAVSPRNEGDPVNPLDGIDIQICAGEQGPENPILCPKDFSWNSWTEWSECFPSCGDGTTNRARSCNQGSNGGAMCPLPAVEMEEKPCKIRNCPNCILVGWQDWTQCSKTCMKDNHPGTRFRKRITKEANPDRPACNPHNDDHTQEESCNTIFCPNCILVGWQEWSQCSKTCMKSNQPGTRFRKGVTKEANPDLPVCNPHNDEHTQEESCNTMLCPAITARINMVTTNFPYNARVQIPCEVNSYNRSTVKWAKDGQEIVPDSRVIILRSNTLAIYGARAEDTGTFTCYASDGYNEDEASVNIHVENVEIREGCEDNPYFSNCKLIVKARYCGNKYYARFCCRSCTIAGQLV